MNILKTCEREFEQDNQSVNPLLTLEQFDEKIGEYVLRKYPDFFIDEQPDIILESDSAWSEEE